MICPAHRLVSGSTKWSPARAGIVRDAKPSSLSAETALSVLKTPLLPSGGPRVSIWPTARWPRFTSPWEAGSTAADIISGAAVAAASRWISDAADTRLRMDRPIPQSNQSGLVLLTRIAFRLRHNHWLVLASVAWRLRGYTRLPGATAPSPGGGSTSMTCSLHTWTAVGIDQAGQAGIGTEEDSGLQLLKSGDTALSRSGAGP